MTGFIRIRFFLVFIMLANIILPQSKKNIVATVGEFQITADEFKKRYEDYLFATGVDDKFKTRIDFLQNMIDEIVAYNYDDNQNIFNDKNYRKEINWLWKQAVLAYLKDQEIYAKITVSDAEAREAFKRMNQKIAVSHLYAKSKEEAYQLYGLLKKGFSFEDLAHEVFTDSLLKNNGGYLGYFSWGDLDPAFEEKAFSMKVGEISPPVKTEKGYSIIRLEDKVERPLISEYEYLTRKKKIVAAVAINKKRPAERAFVESVIDLENFEFNDKCLQRILSRLSADSLRMVEQNNTEKNKNRCVKYGTTHYSYPELMERINALPVYHLKKIKDLKSLKTVIKGFFLQDTLLNLAHKKGYDTLDIVRNKFNAMRTNLFMNLKQIEVLKNMTLPDSLLYDFYENHIDFFSTKRKIDIEEIITRDSLTADSLLELINKGKDFGELAARFSVNKETARKKGHVGFVLLSKFGNFKSLFWSAKPGEILGPVKLKNGWGLYKIIEKKDSQPIPFTKVKEDVEILAKYAYRKKYFDNYLRSISEKIDVKINKPLLGSIQVLSLKSIPINENFKFEEK